MACETGIAPDVLADLEDDWLELMFAAVDRRFRAFEEAQKK